MNYWDYQANGESNPRVPNKKPTHSFDLTSEVEKERTLLHWFISFCYQKVVRVVMYAVDC